MEVFEHPPHPDITTCINRYLYVDAVKKEMPQVKIIPTGFSYLTRVYGNSACEDEDGNRHQLPDIFLGGQVTRQKLCVYPDDRFCHFGIEFKPAGIYKLFHIPMDNTLNGFADFADLVTSEAYAAFHQLFSESLSFEEQCARLDRYFLHKEKEALKCPITDQVIELLNEEKSDISIEEAASKVYLSARQLRRKFKMICGISPQAYRNIIQMNQIYELIDEGEHARLQDLAYKCGYFDVAHFINSFKQRMGENPSAFLESDESFINTYIKHTNR